MRNPPTPNPGKSGQNDQRPPNQRSSGTSQVGAIYPAGVKTGIILHGRYAAAIDPAIAQRAAQAQAAMYHTEPADAAEKIVDATVRRRARTMVGREAGLVDVLTRLAPVRYWAAMRRPLRDAIDTTTPIR